MNTNQEEINRLNFENFIWIVFASLCILNINGDNLEKDYIETNNQNKHNEANRVFEFTLSITFLIYIYFFLRNYRALKKAPENQKRLYEIKTLGSLLLISGIICLIYFQKNQTNFEGSPAL